MKKPKRNIEKEDILSLTGLEPKKEKIKAVDHLPSGIAVVKRLSFEESYALATGDIQVQD